MDTRRDKTNYYLDIAEEVSKRSTCLRRHYGAVIVASVMNFVAVFMQKPMQLFRLQETG